MAEEPTSTLTKKASSAANQPSSKPTKATSTGLARSSQLIARLGHLLTIASVVGSSWLAATGLNLPRFMESQAQTVFYLLRGSMTPPEEIVILAIDDQSISIPAQYYRTDQKQYAYWEPLKAFPYKREAYAIAIQKLIAAGARSVAIDVVFDTPSSYGNRDDQKLRSSLQRDGSQVTLAAYSVTSETDQGPLMQLKPPQQMFLTGSTSMGLVNFPFEVDGKIHLLASEFSKLVPDENALTVKIPDFDQAVLRAANVNYQRPNGNHIYFYGPSGTFKVISFCNIFDPVNWNSYLQQGKVFKDKIVLIGATTQLGNDYYPVAAASSWLYPGRMSGVEIHANAIATLMQGKTIAQAIESSQGRGLFVLGLVGGCALVLARIKRGTNRFFFSLCLGVTWGGISYLLFVYSQLIFPTAVPVVAITAIGLSYLGTEVTREILKQSQLIDIFQKYPSNHVVQEILSQHDFKDLIQQREMAICGKVLDGRYKIVKVLGSGGFSETYIASDTKLPGNPLCVVKQLKPVNNKSDQLTIARRLFSSEAQTLQRLGKHEQIPQLFAYFEEEEEFYLVQEYIVGHTFSQELPTGKRLLEVEVIAILRDLLQTLAFVHKNGVIHRDIKPSNIIRREADGKLVLIDFGAVKEATTQLLDNQEQSAFTIGIGTKGYAPSEQCFGRPQYSSDIYAVGMIGIKALTGITPHEMERDANGELKWIDKADVSHTLAQILSKMVREDFQQRYQSALKALEALNELIDYSDIQMPTEDLSMITLSLEQNSDTPTTPWTGVSEDIPSASSTSILPPHNQ